MNLTRFIAFYKVIFILWKVLVCNYGPGGNWLENAVYEQGEPGSNCPAGLSATSAGLCAWKKSTDSSIQEKFENTDSRKVWKQIFEEYL